MKKIIILALIVNSLFISGCSCSVKKEEEENNNNNNNNNDATVITDKNVIGEQNVNGISFENTKFEVRDGGTKVITKVRNNTGAEYQLENFQMIITDKDDVVITILTNTIGETLAKDEEKTYETPLALDLSKAAKVEYIVNIAILD